ncbi:interleukin 17a/f1 [Mugil cephalus]|uniref:interleukin 17a/f1 n=1 Tax=Mugil cephalus TaxID=48193 RepID=UPI001FB803DA|nr:interleukin 17a/f1 [Mugil cephalus]
MMVMMVMVVMVVMVTEVAAVPKHRRSPNGAAVETVPLQIDASTVVPSRNLRPLGNASISPWIYNNSTDNTLFPHVLYEARCLLRGCLDSEGREDLSLESRPIMHQMMLLRRVRSPGGGHSYHYRLEFRLIAVGCTCVRPVVQVQE